MPDLDNAPAEKAQPREAAAENTVAQQNIQSQQDGSFSKTFQDQNNATAKASEQMAQNGTIGKMEIGSDSDGKYGSMDGSKAMNPAPSEPPRQDQDGERPKDGNKNGKQGFDGAQAMNPEPKEPPKQDQDGRVTRGQSSQADGISVEPKDSPRQDDGGSKDHRNNDNRSKDHTGKDGNLTKQGTLEQYPDKLEGGSAQGGAGGKHGENFQPGFGGAGGKIGEKNGQSGEGGTGGFKPGRGIGQDGPAFDPRSDLRPKSDEGPGQYSSDRNPFSKPTPNPGRSKW